MVTLFNIRPKGLNVGNDVISTALRHFLVNAFGEIVNIINIPATSRYESHGNCGFTPRIVYEINQYGDGVILGGGNLYENGELDVNATALQALEVPLMLFSLSRGRIYNRNNELVTRTDVMSDSTLKLLNQKASISLSRDVTTHNYLQSIGCEKSEVGACPTLFLSTIADSIPDYSSRYGDTIFISVRTPSLMSVPLKKQRQLHTDLENLTDYARSISKEVILLCHDYRDLSFAASFNNIEYLYTDNAMTFLGLLKACKLLITYRLHSFLPALSLGKLAVNISYDERAQSLIETTGLSSWDINMFKSDNILSDVKNRIDNSDQLYSLTGDLSDTIWQKYYEVMNNSFKKFAKMVK